LVHAYAVVSHLKADVGSAGDIVRFGALAGQLGRDFATAGRYLYQPIAAGWYRFTRVDDQIHQDLLHPAWVRFKTGQILREVVADVHALRDGEREKPFRLRYEFR
jgi:hypothetical protein